jgi:hypothetical protein
MRSGQESRNLAEILPSTLVYSDGVELVDAIRNLRPSQPRSRSHADVRMLRFFNELRERSQYYLPVEA